MQPPAPAPNLSDILFAQTLVYFYRQRPRSTLFLHTFPSSACADPACILCHRFARSSPVCSRALQRSLTVINFISGTILTSAYRPRANELVDARTLMMTEKTELKRPFQCTWPGCTNSYARSEHLNRHKLNRTFRRGPAFGNYTNHCRRACEDLSM